MIPRARGGAGRRWDGMVERNEPDGAALAALRAQLNPGEAVLWRGRPDPAFDTAGRLLGWAGWAVVLLGALASAAFLLTALGADARGRLVLLLFSLAPLSVLAVGIALIVLPLRAHARARRSIHAITGERLLTLIRNPSGDELVFIAARSIGPVRLRMAGGGRGTIMIETHSNSGSGAGMRITQTYDWFGVADAQKAYQLIAALQAPRPS